MRLKQLLVWLALAACSWAQAQPALQGPTLPPQRVDGILAVVGDKIIMRSEFETEKMQLARGRELPDSLAAYCAILDQLIIDRFVSIGQGAAAWNTYDKLDTSYFCLVASGNFNIRTNIVGTVCVCVTLNFSTQCKNCSASKWSMTIDVPPVRCTDMFQRKGAA